MAFERVLAKQPKTAVPDDAVCYICLDGGTLLRDCACRGSSAGFAHVDCLAEMAKRDEWVTIVDGRERINVWMSCSLCHQAVNGALSIEMHRRRWRHIRDGPITEDKRHACRVVSNMFREEYEHDAADRLDDEANQGLARDEPEVLVSEIMRANSLFSVTNPDVALEILTGMRTKIERYKNDPNIYPDLRAPYVEVMSGTLDKLRRFEEALLFANEAVELATAYCGLESATALRCRASQAELLIEVGRVDEGKAILSQVLATQTRILGANHADTRYTKRTCDSWSC